MQLPLIFRGLSKISEIFTVVRGTSDHLVYICTSLQIGWSFPDRSSLARVVEEHTVVSRPYHTPTTQIQGFTISRVASYIINNINQWH